MRAPAFWWRKPRLAAALLRPAGAIYGAVATARLRRQGARAGVPVVCIGDFTLGGAGKTPVALATAQLLADAGERPVFLTRGYGGDLAGPVLVALDVHRMEDVGDEPLLLARAFPTVVARDRSEGAALACKRGASVIVMDDGFHNPSLVKDCAVLAIDAARGLGNGQVFPAGPLRAPPAAQLERAHAVLAVGEGNAATEVVAAARRRGLPVFGARLEPEASVVAELRGRPVLAFSGIGDPEKFFATLTNAGIPVTARRAFADHHRFTTAEAAELLAEADRRGLTPVTTEKDFVRLAGDDPLRALRERARALPVQLAFDDADAFRALVLSRVRARA